MNGLGITGISLAIIGILIIIWELHYNRLIYQTLILCPLRLEV